MAVMSFGDYARLMQKRGDQITNEMRAATQKATDALYAESKRLMNVDIYSKAEDTTSFSWTDRASGEGFVNTIDGGGKRRRRKVQHAGKQILVANVGDDEQFAGGKKKWRRTGNLRNSEKATMLSAYQGAVDNSAAYALARHNLGFGPASPEAIDPKPKKRRSTTRHAPWRTEAIKSTEQKRFEIYRSAMAYALFR